MKFKYNKYILGSLLSLGFVFTSCDTNDEPTGYDPANYVYTEPTTFSLSLDSSTDNDFTVTYTPTNVGKGYYMVVPKGTAAPTSTQVHAGGGIQSDSFDVDGTTPVNFTIDNGIYGGYEYDVYAINKSTDNFISETVMKLEVTTPDTSNPMFLKESSNPAFTAAGISPFAPVTFAFDEPVFYQGGDITFSGFNTGRVITVSGADITGSGTTSITIANHGTFAPEDFQIVTWAADTFKDNVGKSVDPLTGFNHYFSTRAFTLEETIKLMAGQYDYSTVFYGGLSGFYNNLSGFLNTSTSGQYEVTTNSNDAYTLNGFNLFANMKDVPFSNPASIDVAKVAPATLPIYISKTDAGQLANYPQQIASGVPLNSGGQIVQSYWSHYAGSFFGIPIDSPGSYDFNAGTITHWLQLQSSDGSGVDDIDYLYTRIGTYPKSSTSRLEELKSKNKELKSKLKNDKISNDKIDQAIK